jgi:hypothetical protein
VREGIEGEIRDKAKRERRATLPRSLQAVRCGSWLWMRSYTAQTLLQP